MPEIPGRAMRQRGTNADVITLVSGRRAVQNAAMTRLLALLAIACLLAGPASALDMANTPEAKCLRYRAAWQEATARRPMAGIGGAFRTRHDAFLASGCQTPPDVCPRSKEELDLANTLVLLGKSRKLASTFFPFKCGG